MKVLSVRDPEFAEYGRVFDDVDPALTGAIVEALAHERIDALYCSTLTRAQQTAAPLAASRALEAVIVDGIQEIAAGVEEMSTNWQPYVDMLNSWSPTNLDVGLEGGETARQFVTRFTNAVAAMEQAGDELTSIVDAGGAVLNVIVNHRVYGKITADLDIRNRRDVERYLHDIESGKSFPLLTVTSGYHFHRIAAEDEQTLDEIETMLKEKGYLADLMPYEDDLS